MNKFKGFVSVILVVISLVFIVIWQLLFAEEVNVYITCIAVLVLSMLPAFVSFEKGNSNAREITLIATLVSLAVISRAAFYLIPQVKPIGAVVIVSAVCLGAKRGHIIGAFSAFVSNFIFGQGYWTPFQMVALGFVGFIAGLVFKYIDANRLNLAIVGFILTFAVYGLIVDISTIIGAYGNNITLQGVLSVYAAGIPFSFVFGLATAVFLFAFGEPFVKKINRINVKYNLVNTD